MKYERYEHRGDKKGHPFRGNGAGNTTASGGKAKATGKDAETNAASKAFMDDLKAGGAGSSKNQNLSDADNKIGDSLMSTGMKYSQTMNVIHAKNGDRDAARKITHTNDDIGDRLLKGGHKYSEAKTIVDKVAKTRRAAEYEDKLNKGVKAFG